MCVLFESDSNVAAPMFLIVPSNNMLALIMAVALGVGWVAAEFNARSPALRVCLGLLAFAAVAYAGYLGGRLVVALEYAWVPKEHAHLEASLRQIENLLAAGDTNTVMTAVGVYNESAARSTNEFGYYQASLDLWRVLQDRK